MSGKRTDPSKKHRYHPLFSRGHVHDEPEHAYHTPIPVSGTHHKHHDNLGQLTAAQATTTRHPYVDVKAEQYRPKRHNRVGINGKVSLKSEKLMLQQIASEGNYLLPQRKRVLDRQDIAHHEELIAAKQALYAAQYGDRKPVHSSVRLAHGRKAPPVPRRRHEQEYMLICQRRAKRLTERHNPLFKGNIRDNINTQVSTMV